MNKKVIVDELGYIMYECCYLTQMQIEAILMVHPEWAIKCVQTYV